MELKKRELTQAALNVATATCIIIFGSQGTNGQLVYNILYIIWVGHGLYIALQAARFIKRREIGILALVVAWLLFAVFLKYRRLEDLPNPFMIVPFCIDFCIILWYAKYLGERELRRRERERGFRLQAQRRLEPPDVESPFVVGHDSDGSESLASLSSSERSGLVPAPEERPAVPQPGLLDIFRRGRPNTPPGIITFASNRGSPSIAGTEDSGVDTLYTITDNT